MLFRSAVTFGKKNNIPTIVDIRDFWPDIFYETLPSKLAFIGDILFYPWEKKARNIIKNVNAVTGISLKEIISEIWMFIGVLILALIIMMLFPELILWLPEIFGYKG